MTARKRLLAASLGLAGVVLPLAAAGSAQADEENPAAGFPSTQNPLQPVIGSVATGEQLFAEIQDAANGKDRPDGADGNESELPQADPNYVNGPLSGLLNDPFA